MKYKAVVFDLDGTLLDTLGDLAASTNAALAMNGLPQRTLEEVRHFVGNGIGLLIRRAVPEGSSEELIQKVLADFKEHYGIHCFDRTDLYPGIGQMLQLLKAEGIPAAIVSNKADFAVKELWERFFKDTVNVALGEREGIRRKPCPDSVFEVLKCLGVEPQEAVYVGDSEVDVATGANAGMDVIAVTWGFREISVLEEAGANVMAKNPEELWELLK